MEQKKPPGGGDRNATGSECASCTVVHVDFGAPRQISRREAPLTDDEIAGLRTVFRMCPIAQRALKNEN